jgi:hypothetical protein
MPGAWKGTLVFMLSVVARSTMQQARGSAGVTVSRCGSRGGELLRILEGAHWRPTLIQAARTHLAAQRLACPGTR